MSAAELTFWVGMVAALGLDLSLFATLAVPSLQVWPPPGPRTWQYRGTWTLFLLTTIGFLVVGGLDAGSLGLHRWLGEAGTLIFGSTLLVGGTALAGYAMGHLGLQGALGLKTDLVTEGPFAVSRNPGYLGDLLLIVGYMILTDSRLAAVVGTVGAVWFLLAPLAEEPWLEEQYGEAYRRYRDRVPRWIPIRQETTPAVD